MQELKIAWFSPVSPIPTGIADYCSELLEALAPEVERVCVYVDECGFPFPTMKTPFEVFHYRLFPHHHAAEPFDQFVYHLGNSPHANYMYPAMLRFPGVVVLHDIHLCHARTHYYMNREDTVGYEMELHYSHQDEGVAFRNRLYFASGDHFSLTRFPMNRMHIESARGILVHSQYGEEVVREANPEKPLCRTNMHFHDSYPELALQDETDLRNYLGVAPDAYPVIGAFGFIHEIKRPFSILSAFKQLLRVYPKAQLCFVGKPSAELGLDEEIARQRLGNHVSVTGWVSHDDFHRYIRIVDFAVNLRYPTCGETSAAQIRLMGLGVPTIVSRYRQFAEYPDEVLCAIDLQDEERNLYQMMLRLARDEEYRNDLSHRLREYVSREHTLGASVWKYLNFIQETKDIKMLPFAATQPEFSYLVHSTGQARNMVYAAQARFESDPLLARNEAYLELLQRHKEEIIVNMPQIEEI